MLRNNEQQNIVRSSELDTAIQTRLAIVRTAKSDLMPFYENNNVVTVTEIKNVDQSVQSSTSLELAKKGVNDAYFSLTT